MGCVVGTLSEPLTEAERQQLQAYEEWLVQNAQWIDMRLKPLEQQVIKQRKLKKSLSAKQRTVSGRVTPTTVSERKHSTGGRLSA